MYESFLQLRSRPFFSAPQPKNYFPAEGIDTARRTLERIIERGEGPGLIIGPPGTGKTLLCHVIAEKFRGPLAVALLNSGRLKSCQAMLQSIHYELGLPFRGMDEGELRLSLMDFLEPSEDGPDGLLLLVDEAQLLPWRLLDEVRLITNLVRNGESRVRVILSGGPSLEERFASPKLASFAQRVAGRCYLDSLDRAETANYVRAQLIAAGGDPGRLISEDALRSIFRATDGIPRLINQVCDHALVLAALGGHKRLESEAIEEAWADLQQLPVPWENGSGNREPESQIVEFGNLSDDTDAPEAIPFRQNQPAANPPTLHITSPEAQLDAISKQISSIEEEEEETSRATEQVVSTTEVDIDFPEFGDPFSEEFAEEELVLDTYSEIEIFAEMPRVSSWEGRQIGSQLEPISQQAPTQQSSTQQSPRSVTVSIERQHQSVPPAASLHEPTRASQGHPETETLDRRLLAKCGQEIQSDPNRDVEELELEFEAEDFEASSDPVMPEESESSHAVPESPRYEATVEMSSEQIGTEALSEKPAAPEPAVEAETFPRPVLASSSVVGEPSQIVVEEPVQSVPLKRPPRSDFRQLFSKLRRG